MQYGKGINGVPRKVAADIKSNRLPSVIAFMTEFQKAQCLFMMAIEIAALVYKYKGDLDSITLQQLYNNYILIKSISISGYLPVTLTLFGLHIVEMVS